MSAEREQTGALSGVKVIDLSRVLAGPYATQILGDHGADVIKVEPPLGDETREWGPPFRGDPASPDKGKNPSAYYLNINRNKRGLGLDLSKPEAREILFRLLEGADVLVENFKAGTLEKWGLGFDDVLAKRYPRLIHARISGFGDEGPLGGMPGYDAVVQTMCGLSSVNGSQESGPVKLGVPIVDMVSGMNLVIGVLLALRAREATGLGQLVDIALYDSGIGILHPHTGNWLWGNRLAALSGNAHPNLAPYDLFQTATRPVFLGVGNDAQFRKASAVLGAPDLANDPRFRKVGDRNRNRQALTAALAPLFKTQDGVALTHRLLEAGVPAGTLNNVAEALADPQSAARKLIVEKGAYKGIASPVKLSRNKSPFRHTPPDFGADNHSVLREAGFTEPEIARFEAARVLLSKTSGG